MNSVGQTGTDPSNADDTCGIDKCRKTPTIVAGLDTVSQISLGGDFGCAVRTDGTVLCWGNNQYGQLARPLGNPPYAAAPAAVTLPVGKKAAKVSCGEGVACVRTLTNEVYCWGDDRSHMIGTGNSPVVTATPVVFSNTQDVTDLAVSYGAYSAGFQHACALRSDQTVWCWGSNNANELGHIGGTQGDTQTCQILNTTNYYDCNPTPVQVVPAISGATAVSSGVFSSCALGAVGAVCWGDNSYNQAGSTGPGSNMFQPNAVVGVPSPDAGAAALATLLEGGYHLAALDGNKQLWSWGSNRAGQIGVGLVDGGTCAGGGSGCVAPTQTLPTVARLSPGYTFALALQTDGKVMAWGANDEAQLAHLPNATSSGDVPCGSGTCNPTPKAITNLP